MREGEYRVTIEAVKDLQGLWRRFGMVREMEFAAASSTSAAEKAVRLWYEREDRETSDTVRVRVERWDGCVVVHAVAFAWEPRVRVFCGKLCSRTRRVGSTSEARVLRLRRCREREVPTGQEHGQAASAQAGEA